MKNTFWKRERIEIMIALAYWMVNCGKEQRRQAVLVPESSRLHVFGGSRYIRVMEAYLQQD